MAYADVDELARVLGLRTTSEAQADALARVLDTAALEIDKELGRLEEWDFSTVEGARAFPLLAQVNLDRAQDLWMFTEASGGVLGLGSETPIYVPRNSWERHAQTLAPLKRSWGFA